MKEAAARSAASFRFVRKERRPALSERSVAGRVQGSGATDLTVSADFPGLEDREKAELLWSLMQRSVDNVKRLIETGLCAGDRSL